MGKKKLSFHYGGSRRTTSAKININTHLLAIVYNILNLSSEYFKSTGPFCSLAAHSCNTKNFQSVEKTRAKDWWVGTTGFYITNENPAEKTFLRVFRTNFFAPPPFRETEKTKKPPKRGRIEKEGTALRRG